MTVAEGGGIFVSYRRQESSHLAGRLYDRLADRFGEGQVFIDVDTIEPGVDFAEEIFRAVAACKVLLAIIGPSWLTAADESGDRRLDDPADIVRLEIEAALTRGVRVIPILMEGAVMPRRQDLPESLVGLARRNALLIRHDSFRSDAGRLVTAIEGILAPAPGTTAVSGAPHVDDPAFGGTAQSNTEAAQEDRTGAARLLADAERIARSITDKSGEAQALSAVAEALAATDPGRAGRLFTDAERAANSYALEYPKELALGRIATALAATDPDRAEGIARSIRLEFQKALALSSLAEALAATDPGRAARIFTDAERAANRSEEFRKAHALGTVGIALAATDPNHAQRIARSITDQWSQAADDVQIGANRWADEVLISVAGALAGTDPGRAERIARSLTNLWSQAEALSGVAETLAAADPSRAARFFADAERIARSVTDATLKAWTLVQVARALTATDPDRAVRLLTDAERIAPSLTPHFEMKTFMRIAKVFAGIDPGRAERITNTMVDTWEKEEVLSSVVEALAVTEPDRAERIARSITSKLEKVRALSAIAKALVAASL